MKLIAWGNSKLLQMHMLRFGAGQFAYCVDNFSKSDRVAGIPIVGAEVLRSEVPGEFRIVVFAVANASLQAIFFQLSGLGYRYGKEFILYSDFFMDDFLGRFQKSLGWKPRQSLYQAVLSYTLNSRKPIHTTILGTWLFLEIMEKTADLGGSIAEIGAFEGGNALCALSLEEKHLHRDYFIFDSFEGFPELTVDDPNQFKSGDYRTITSFSEIIDSFHIFPHAKIVKGFIPETFKHLPDGNLFSLVFYDCDLYQPALDTYRYFWDRIVPGGYLLVHDYEAEPGGFEGVRKATNEFFEPLGVPIVSFYENTMAVIQRPLF